MSTQTGEQAQVTEQAQVRELARIERASGKVHVLVHLIYRGSASFRLRSYKCKNDPRFFEESFTGRDLATLRGAIDQFEALERERQCARPRPVRPPRPAALRGDEVVHRPGVPTEHKRVAP